jgi:hypothetical protein
MYKLFDWDLGFTSFLIGITYKSLKTHAVGKPHSQIPNKYFQKKKYIKLQAVFW